VTTRRKFLESAAVVSAAPLAPAVVLGDGTQRASAIGAVYDARYREGRAFGLRAGQLGVPVRGIEGDITDLWQDEVRGRWQSASVAIAGLTERPALFMLEQLAWEFGLRVVYQAEHEPNGPGSTIHRVVRSGRPGLSRYLDAAGAAWPDVLADQMLIRAEQVASGDGTPSGAAMAAFLNEPTKLYSWIIAPRPAATAS
jgi:hypothetical protein